jgi:hypothetical protein
MKNEEFNSLMRVVEADETWIGGLKKIMHKSRRHGMNQRGPVLSNKIEVISAIARKGNVVCQMMGNGEDAGFDTHAKFVGNVTSNNVSLVATVRGTHCRELDWLDAYLMAPSITAKKSMFANGFTRRISSSFGVC